MPASEGGKRLVLLERQERPWLFPRVCKCQGICSLRRFELESGAFLGLEYKSGDYQENFSEYLKSALGLAVSRQPNLEKDCNVRLPQFVLSEPRQQLPSR